MLKLYLTHFKHNVSISHTRKRLYKLLLVGFFKVNFLKPQIFVKPQHSHRVKQFDWSMAQEHIIFTLLRKYNVTSDKEYHPRHLWYRLYYNYYMQLFFQAPAMFKNLNAKNLVPKDVLHSALSSASNIKWRRVFIKNSNEVIEVLFVSLWLKNINLFVKWLRRYFEAVHLKKHKKLFAFLTYILGEFVWNYDLQFNLRGLRVKLRGKFGKAGSVRKSRKYIKRGKCSYSSKFLAYTHRSTVIRTATGVFGIKMEVFF